MEDESASQRNSDALPVEEEKLIADDKEMFEGKIYLLFLLIYYHSLIYIFKMIKKYSC